MARLFVFALLAVATPGLALAQASASLAPAALTADDYARAERFLAAAANPLVVGGTVNATRLPDDRFTYRSSTGEGGGVHARRPGEEDAGTRLRPRAAGRGAGHRIRAPTVDAKKLPFPDHRALGRRHVGGVRRRPEALLVRREGRRLCVDPAQGDANAVVSPDGKKAAYIKNWNLWMRDIASKAKKSS